MSTEFSHIPVMAEEVISLLEIKENGIYVDGTVGGGGHSSIIESKGGKVIGIDRDKTALKASGERLKDATLVHGNYSEIKNILKNLKIEKIDGALLDLGVSSYQLDTPERGFSYRYDAPLDMRMDETSELTAYDVVNGYSASALEKILFEYGEESYARAIVRRIENARKVSPIKTTFELSEIVKAAYPAGKKRDKHPAKKTFQAIRIEVNNELSVLSGAVRDFCMSLKKGGRFAVITFHSLEDRIVKQTFAELIKGCTCPKEFPVCVCGGKPEIKSVTKKPITAGKSELEKNSRSSCAKLRVVEKI